MQDWLRTYPELLALLLLGIGVLAAILIRPLLEHGARLFNQTMEAQGFEGLQISERNARLLGGLAFWLLVGAGILGAVGVLGMGAGIVAEWTATLIGHLPRLVAGLIIIGGGYLVALLAHGLVDRIWAQQEERELVGLVVRWSVVLVALVTGLKQMGLDVGFLGDVLLIGFAVVLSGLALAFALGSREHVANLIAHRELARYRIGQRIRIADFEGRIVEIGSTTLVLDTEAGLVSLPNARFAREPVVILEDD